MINFLIIFNLLSIFHSDTLQTDYVRMCEFDKKKHLYNCDEIILNSNFILCDSQIYQYTNSSHQLENLYTYQVDSTFSDKQSKTYVCNDKEEIYMFVKRMLVTCKQQIRQTIMYTLLCMCNTKQENTFILK
jgi:Na+-transporting NADH:ubiquinone oxidoreductase subunit NqrC